MSSLPLPERTKGMFSLILLAFVFATMGIFARYLDLSFELFEQTYLRIGIAFILGIIIFGRNIEWEKFRTLSRRDGLILIGRAIALYLGVVLFTEAILNTKYGNASFIAAAPLLPLFGYLMLRETVAWRTVAYIGLGFVGVLLIAVQDFSMFEFGYGEVMALLSMLAFDISYVARKWQSEHLNNQESTVFMFAVGAFFLFISSMTIGEGLPTLGQFTPLVIGTLIVAALFNVANLYLTNYGFARVKVAVAGNLLTLETVFALLYSLFLFGEVPLLREIIGGAIIVLSVILINRSEK